MCDAEIIGGIVQQVVPYIYIKEAIMTCPVSVNTNTTVVIDL